MGITSHRMRALVKASDYFDPLPAEGAGIDLSRVLLVRCAKRHKRLNSVEQAFKATEILVHDGGFELIIVDLSAVAERLIRKVSLTTWHRFSRAAERASTTLIFLTSVPVAQSCASVTLHIKQGPGIWTALQRLPHTPAADDLRHMHIISGVQADHEVVREKLRKPIQSFREKLPPFSKQA